MRVDLISWYFHPALGGIETYTYELAQHLAAEGHDVTVHTTFGRLRPGEMLPVENVGKILVRRYRSYPGHVLFPDLGPDALVHTNCLSWNPNLVEVLRKGRRRLVVTLHAALLSFNYPALLRAPGSRQIIRWVIGRYDGFAPYTETERRHLVEVLGVPPSRAPLIRIGVEDALFGPIGDVSCPPLDALGLDGQPIVLCLGRIASNKRFWVGVRALAKLDESVHFVIAGPAVDPNEAAWIARMADGLGVSDRYHWLGPVDGASKKALLKRSSVLLVPGWEAFSIVAVEAMAVGTPVVGSDCEPLAEVLGGGERGFLFDFDQPETAAAEVSRVLDGGSEVRSVVRAARAWAAENCSWPRIAQRVTLLYEEVTRGG